MNKKIIKLKKPKKPVLHLLPAVLHLLKLFSQSYPLAPIRASSSPPPPPPPPPAFQFSNASFEDNHTLCLPNKSLNLQQNPNCHPPRNFPAVFQFSFIKTTLIATAAAAAIFFSRFHFFNVKPAYASASGAAATVETTPNDAVADEEREKYFEEHLLSNPDDIEALRNLMEVRIKNRKMQEAIAVLEKLIELEPNEVEWPLMKSHLYIYTGDFESAKRGFSEIISKDPFRVEAYHGLVMAESQDESSGEFEQIESRIEDAMKMCKKEDKKHDLRDFKLLLAQIRVIEGKYEEALKLYQALVKEEPRDFRPYLCQGIIYTLLRKIDDAEKSFRRWRTAGKRVLGGGERRGGGGELVF